MATVVPIGLSITFAPWPRWEAALCPTAPSLDVRDSPLMLDSSALAGPPPRAPSSFLMLLTCPRRDPQARASLPPHPTPSTPALRCDAPGANPIWSERLPKDGLVQALEAHEEDELPLQVMRGSKSYIRDEVSTARALAGEPSQDP